MAPAAEVDDPAVEEVAIFFGFLQLIVVGLPTDEVNGGPAPTGFTRPTGGNVRFIPVPDSPRSSSAIETFARSALIGAGVEASRAPEVADLGADGATTVPRKA